MHTKSNSIPKIFHHNFVILESSLSMLQNNPKDANTKQPPKVLAFLPFQKALNWILNNSKHHFRMTQHILAYLSSFHYKC